MFRESEFFVFTLGLTEGWRSRRDGAVFPLAPGVTAGEYDESLHEFVNFDVADTIADLRSFLAGLRTVNPRVRVLLTVSTGAADRHLRTQARADGDDVQQIRAAGRGRYPGPGTGLGGLLPIVRDHHRSFNGGAYYQDDAREVTDAGVAHVMRCFARHYLARTTDSADAIGDAEGLESAAVVRSRADIVCDEEAIDQVSD
jgi:hypothetical protein